jgi:DNA repair exonuclease SbcCD ATPase subunit
MSTEVEHSRQTISELQEKVKAAEQKATDHYEAEIRRVTKQYENASARTKDLDGMVKTLQGGQTEKVAMLTDKYKDQTEAYAILSAVCCIIPLTALYGRS